jgi:hypothetical protein
MMSFFFHSAMLLVDVLLRLVFQVPRFPYQIPIASSLSLCTMAAAADALYAISISNCFFFSRHCGKSKKKFDVNSTYNSM